MIDKIVEYMHIDYNTFWTIIITSLGIVIPMLSNVFTYFKNKNEERKLEYNIKVKYVRNNFYLWLLISHMIVSTVLVVICDFLRRIGVGLFFLILFIIATWLFVIHITLKNKSVRLGLLRMDVRYKKILIYLPIIFTSIGMSASLYEVGNILYSLLFYVCIGCVMICEFIGFSIFHFSYTIYEHSYVNLVMNNGERIECIKIETLFKKGKWIEYETISTKGKVIFDSVMAMEYYGDEKYIVRDFLGNLILEE